MEDAEDPLAPQPSDYDFINSQQIKTYVKYQFSAANNQDHANQQKEELCHLLQVKTEPTYKEDTAGGIKYEEGEFSRNLPVNIESSSKLTIENVFSLDGDKTTEFKDSSFVVDNPSNICWASHAKETLVLNVSKRYKCAEGYKTPQRLNLKRHKDIVATKQLSCDVCDYKTGRKKDLIEHINVRHNHNHIYKCDLCGYISLIRHNVERHRETVHFGIKRFSCHLCNYKTGYKRSLKNHISKHNRNEVYSCGLCDYSTREELDFKKHQNKFHLGTKRLSCGLCKYATTDEMKLKGHRNSKHNLKHVYKCDLCHYETPRSYNLTKHKNDVHLGIKHFSCRLCKYKTRDETQLKEHIKSKHEQNGNYKCDLCHYETALRYNVARHKNDVHLGNKRSRVAAVKVKQEINTIENV